DRLTMKTGFRWALFAATLALWWLIAVIPGMRRRMDLPNLIVNAERRAAAIKQQGIEEADRILERQELETDLGSLLYVTSESEHYEMLLRDIHRVSLESRVQLLGIAPRTPGSTGDFRLFPMQFEIQGDLEGITRLLLALRDLRPGAEIDRMSLQTAGDLD